MNAVGCADCGGDLGVVFGGSRLLGSLPAGLVATLPYNLGPAATTGRRVQFNTGKTCLVQYREDLLSSVLGRLA